MSAGFVTGCQMAHMTALAAARHHVLEREGWNLLRDGLQGAPRIRVLVGEQRHVTVDRALRYLGIGSAQIEPLAADGEGRMDVDELRRALAAGEGPTIVSAQAGDVNTRLLRPARGDRGRRSTAPAPGSTSTAPSVSGPLRHLASATSSPAPSGQIRGRPMRTSG